MQMRLIRSEVLELRGPDALAFAHAQFMNDVRTLGDGQWQWSGWLTPKGRLVAFFAVVRIDSQSLLLWLPAGGADALAQGLQRFVFRSKVNFDSGSPWVAYGDFTDAATSVISQGAAFADSSEAMSARLEPAVASGPTSVSLPFPVGIDGDARSLLIEKDRSPERAADTAAAADSTRDLRWLHADLALGVPYIAAGAASSGQFVPQWLSLDRLNAYNLKKGCYPGQEIVARMHFLGQSKRSAFRIDGVGPSPPPLAKVLSAQGDVIGEVVWSLPSDGGAWHALSVLAIDRSKDLAMVQGAGAASLSV